MMDLKLLSTFYHLGHLGTYNLVNSHIIRPSIHGPWYQEAKQNYKPNTKHKSLQ